MTKFYISSELEHSLDNPKNKISESKTKVNKTKNIIKKIDKYFTQEWIKKYFNK